MAFFNFSLIPSERNAVCWNKQMLTYGDLQLRVKDICEKLEEINDAHSGAKNLVLICLPRSLEEFLITVSLLEAGRPGLNIGQEQSREQIEDLLQRHPIKRIITHKKFLKSLFVNFSEDQASPLTEEVVILEKIFLKDFNEALPSDCRWTLLTSGSKGSPKIVMISAEELKERAAGEIRDFKIQPGHRLLNFLSFSHDLGLNQLLSSLMSQSCLYIHKYVFLNDLLHSIRENRIQGFTAIANVWREFLKKDVVFDFESSDLKYFTISGESLNEDELKKLFVKVGNQIKIYRTYGQTETFRSLINSSRTDFSTGHPLSDVRLELEFTEEEKFGELIHYGAGSMLGYLNEQQSNGGIRTGDFFQLTPSGGYQYICRKDDMKKINGIRFYPAQIENALLKNPLISAACVFLLNDADSNEVIVALLSLKEEMSDKELRNFLLAQLNPLFIPKHFIQLQSFPKTHSGKINRKELQAIGTNFLLKI